MLTDLSPFVESRLRPIVARRGRSAPVRRAPQPDVTQILPDDQYHDLRGALRCIPSDDRELWINYGMALKPYGDRGYQLWYEWSSKSDEFDPDDMKGRWEGLTPRGLFDERAITIRSIFKQAGACGWRNPARRSEDNPRCNGNYTLKTYAEIMSAEVSLELVENILPASGTACIYGQSGAGKTFLAIDLMMAICQGKPEWFGYNVMQRPVVYLALEGMQGIRDRLTAYTLHGYNQPPEDNQCRILDQRFHLHEAADRSALVEAVRAVGFENPVVVIDTMTRATPGLDLNGPADMGTVVDALDDIQRQLGGLIIAIYHSMRIPAIVNTDSCVMVNTRFPVHDVV